MTPRSTLSFIFVLVIAAIGVNDSSAQTITWTGPTNGSQNLSSASTLAFTVPGTYTLSVDHDIVFTFQGAAGGGGGAHGADGGT